ncbi:hypothetical protein [Vibrio barjaei]|uniref:hypothetical protein n=1 Tax=Vibrio barjaei TaxID=1676683 RepID=UPI00228335AA|nr:hypothetical protein [Vibrio barjaei]MCY9870472.1 hypothetical protein [Vibrio barjaei]
MYGKLELTDFAFHTDYETLTEIVPKLEDLTNHAFNVKRFVLDGETVKLELVEAGEVDVDFTLSDIETNYSFECISSLITDYENFDFIVGQCKYQDTGGGWRDTYRRRVRPAILQFLKDGKDVIDESEQPYFSIINNQK